MAAVQAQMDSLPWITTVCPATDDVLRQPRRDLTSSGVLATCASASATRHDDGACTGSSGVWRWCARSIHGKGSPGVAAFAAGATLLVNLPTWWLPTGTRAFNTTLQHLTSWHQMGTAAIDCIGSCRCELQKIDATRLASAGEISSTVFVERTFEVSFNASDETSPSNGVPASSCGLVLHVLNETSSSGHHFKLRDLVLTVRKGSLCYSGMNKAEAQMLEVRNGLRCGPGH